MARKILEGVIIAVFFLIFLSIFVKVETRTNAEEVHLEVSNISMSFAAERELDNIINGSLAEGYSHVEMAISENYTIKAKKVIEVKTQGTVIVPLVYTPNIHFDNITIKNAKLLNASILITEYRTILLLKLEVPEGRRARIDIKYWGRICESCEDKSLGRELNYLFVRWRSRDEIELSQGFFLPVEGNKIPITKISLKLPKAWEGWKGIALKCVCDDVCDECLPLEFRKYNEELRLEDHIFNTFMVIIGNFKVEQFTVNNVNVTMYLSRNASSNYTRVVEDIIETFSSLYQPYPYQKLTIVFSRNFLPHSGGNFNYVVLVVPNASPSLLAHEISHSWFGHYAKLRRIHESLATYSAHLFALQFYERHPEELKRYNMTLSEALDYSEKQIITYSHNYTKPLARVYIEGILDPRIRNAIQYMKGAFVFRSLQFVLGNETFFEGLRELLKECHGRECNLTDVQDVFEKVSGQDLDWFFEEWFYTAKLPDYEVENLSVTQRDDKYLLNFEIVDKNNFTMPLEVEVMTSKEKLVKKVWIKGKAKVSFELNDKPTKITLDPNEWMINENKKYNVEGIEIIVK